MNQPTRNYCRAKSYLFFAAGAASSLLALLVYAIVAGAPFESANAGIPGRYVLVNHLRPHSRAVVNLDIYEDFNCPACQSLENDGMAKLQRRFSGRLIIRKHYLTPSPEAGSALLLYQLAQRSGQGELVASDLFAARLKHAFDAANLPTVRKIAKRHGIEAEFDQAYATGAWKKSFEYDWSKAKERIKFFPFVVIDEQIATDADAGNLEAIVDSLLTSGHSL